METKNQDNEPEDSLSQSEVNYAGGNQDEKPKGLAVKEPNLTPLTAGFLGLGIMVLLYFVVASVVFLLIFGINVIKLPQTTQLLLQTVSQFVFLLLPIFLFAKIVYNDFKVFRFKLPEIRVSLLFLFGLFILILIGDNYQMLQQSLINSLAEKFTLVKAISDAADSMTKILMEQYKILTKFNGIGSAFLVIFTVSITPAITEELCFRGFVQGSFEKHPKFSAYIAILLTSIFFAIFHLNPFGFIPLIMLAFYFGYAVKITGSIYTSMLLHFINNFVAIILYNIFGYETYDSFHLRGQSINYAIFETIILLLLFSSVIYVIQTGKYKKKE